MGQAYVVFQHVVSHPIAKHVNTKPVVSQGTKIHWIHPVHFAHG